MTRPETIAASIRSQFDAFFARRDRLETAARDIIKTDPRTLSPRDRVAHVLRRSRIRAGLGYGRGSVGFGIAVDPFGEIRPRNEPAIYHAMRVDCIRSAGEHRRKGDRIAHDRAMAFARDMGAIGSARLP